MQFKTREKCLFVNVNPLSTQSESFAGFEPLPSPHKNSTVHSSEFLPFRTNCFVSRCSSVHVKSRPKNFVVYITFILRHGHRVERVFSCKMNVNSHQARNFQHFGISYLAFRNEKHVNCHVYRSIIRPRFK